MHECAMSFYDRYKIELNNAKTRAHNNKLLENFHQIKDLSAKLEEVLLSAADQGDDIVENVVLGVCKTRDEGFLFVINELKSKYPWQDLNIRVINKYDISNLGDSDTKREYMHFLNEEEYGVYLLVRAEHKG